MLSIEQRNKIAKYRGVKVLAYIGGNDIYLPLENGDTPSPYDPLGDAENSKVFKALVDECNNRAINIFITSGRISLKKPGFFDEMFDSEFNNESICLSYLAVMGE